MRRTRLPRLHSRSAVKALTAAAVCVSLAAATGCGTTVSAGEVARQGAVTDGLGGTTAADPSSTASDPTTSLGAGTSTGSGPTSVTGSTSGSAPTSTSATTPTGTAVGTGTTSGIKSLPSTAPVEIGFLVVKCGNCDLLGSGYHDTTHSPRDVLQALVTDKNKHGGLLGHEIVPVYAVEDTSSSNFSTMLQAICATFTQDHHVKAVVGAGFGYSDILANCLAKKGIPIVDAVRATGLPDSQDLKAHPAYVLSGEPSLDVYQLVAFTSGVIDGWLTPKSKLGTFTYDCPASARVYKNVVKPYLSAQHIIPAVEYSSSCFTGSSDIGKAAQDVQQAVLKMRSNNVDVVSITDVPLVVFAEFADSQGYHPKYLATEGGGPSYASLLSSAQASNIHAPGWEPSFDLAASQQPALSAAQSSCLARLKSGGLTSTSSSEYLLYFGHCGGWDLFLDAVAKAADVTSAGVLTAINGLGSSFVSPFLLEGASTLGPNKHGAAVRYRTETYVKSCSCFQYSGPSRSMPTG